ncbi:hypothetical protein CR513_35069, partial [Mucuna pruriens]
MVMDISLLEQLSIQRGIYVVVELNKRNSITLPKKNSLNRELLQTFRKVEINIPFLDVIKHITKYAKFLKELCTHKRNKLKGEVEMKRNVFALIKREQVSTLI